MISVANDEDLSSCASIAHAHAHIHIAVEC